jgi:hypothetical protein
MTLINERLHRNLEQLRNALKVLVLTKATRDWLLENDPKALAQACTAIADSVDPPERQVWLDVATMVTEAINIVMARRRIDRQLSPDYNALVDFLQDHVSVTVVTDGPQGKTLKLGTGMRSIPFNAEADQRIHGDICPSRDDAQPHIIADGRCVLCLKPVAGQS